MKQPLILLLIVFSSFTFTGCFEFIETVSLNKDGSGDFSLKVDMSGLMQDEFMKSMILQGIAEADVDLDNAEALFETDSTIYFSDLPAEARKAFSEYPDLPDRMKMVIKISESEELMFFDFQLAFKSVEEIDFMLSNLDKLGDATGDNPASGLTELLPGMSEKGIFKWSKKQLTRMPSESDPSALGMESDELEMAKMMMSSAKYTTIYHFPGKVKKVSNKNSVISGNSKTVTTEVSFLDMLEGDADIDNEIKFKGK